MCNRQTDIDISKLNHFYYKLDLDDIFFVRKEL